mmetsp:Transcript_7722/g.8190  ORF Transcript_7722/g.8190 Transcript_7722/m.8190 type:complete len:293 (+) Transcript_7722:87-965(+)
MTNNNNNNNKKKSSTTSALIAGCIAGGIEATSVWPMEYMKTQLQLQSKTSKPPFTGVLSGIVYTVKNKGFFALYDGLGVTLLFSIPKAGIRFGANAWCKDMLRGSNNKLTMTQDFLAGVGAGIIEAIFAVTPMESIKTITIEHHLGVFSGIKHIWKEYGIAGFYKGAFATILKQSSNQGLRFMAFGQYKEFMTNGGKDKLSVGAAFLGGMVSGLFSTTLNNPFDVVKTRMQGSKASMYKNTFDCFIQMYKVEGFLSFYSGLVPRLGRVLPGQGIIFMSFETIQAWVDNFLEK